MDMRSRSALGRFRGTSCASRKARFTQRFIAWRVWLDRIRLGPVGEQSARYYTLSAAGRRHLSVTEEAWPQLIEAVARVLKLA